MRALLTVINDELERRTESVEAAIRSLGKAPPPAIHHLIKLHRSK